MSELLALVNVGNVYLNCRKVDRRKCVKYCIAVMCVRSGVNNNSVIIAQCVVDMKSEIEKLREQIQNAV